MRYLYVGLAKNSESGSVRPACASPSKSATEDLLAKWCEEKAEDSDGRNVWEPFGVFTIKAEYSPGIAESKEKQEMSNLNDEIHAARMIYHNRLRALKRLVEAELEAPADQRPSDDLRDVAAVVIQRGGCLDSLLCYRYKEALNRSET